MDFRERLRQWLISLKENQVSYFLLHLLIIFVLGVSLLLGFFYVYLPLSTHHGETITVPDLEGMSMDEVEKFLKDRDLRYIVTDSSYNPRFPAFTVLKQEPQKNAKVKINRRIHLTVNSGTPPMERVPNIIDNSIRQADQILESYGFKRGEITYVPDDISNTVLRIFANGKELTKEELAKGVMLPKGTRIDMEVGDGLGNTEFDLPNLTGKPLAEVELYLRGVGLGIGSIIYEQTPGVSDGAVIRQKPVYTPGKKIKVGDVIDLWVAGFAPENAEEY
jgi:beta-lactam-binding protein with PASTA domain